MLRGSPFPTVLLAGALSSLLLCGFRYGVSDVLEGLGIEVKYMGQPLTEILKGDWKVLTF